MDSDHFSDTSSLPDSDVELQEAFARGDLKPGLVIQERPAPKKAPVINNVPRLLALLKEIQLPEDFHWVEKLDVSSGLAPLAPEIAVQLNEQRERREKELRLNALRKSKKKGATTPVVKTIEDDPVHNDFQRELNFHRQAQSAIMTCLPKLQKLGVSTRRPEDYFAEMAKSDTHMQKVASVLLKKQTAAEKAEKIRKVRDQKKIAKQTQVQVIQERQKAKKEMIDSVKKYRKGQTTSLDFLEERKSSRGGGAGRGGGGGVSRKREMKNERYGYGGKKSGSKRNTRDSLDNVSASRFQNRGGGGGRGRGGGAGRGRGGGAGRGRGGGMGRGGGAGLGRGGGMGRGGSPGRGRGGGSMNLGGGGRVVAKRPGKSNRIKAKARSA